VHDPDTVDAEGPTINRLAVGLVADGERVGCVLDPASAGVLPSLAGVDRFEVPFRVPPWRRSTRRELLAALTERRVPHIVVARGRPAWPVALELADLHRRALAVECWDEAQIPAIARFARRRPQVTALAPTESMAEMLRERLGGPRVRLVPVGVPVPADPGPVFDRPDDAIAVCILGPIVDPAAWRSLVIGLARVARDFPQLHVFIELVGPSAHAAWQELDRLDLLSRVSAITAATKLRPLITRCDLLVVPQPPRRVRSLILEAMAMGVPLIAAADPCLDMLEDGDTADIAELADADQWAGLLRRRLEDPVAARAQGLRGRSRIARDHGSTVRVTAMAETLRELQAEQNARVAEQERLAAEAATTPAS
jgi:glycosyltransferase involved in cell wall biosynthesis